MVETIVAVVGVVCTVLGLGISLATYHQQAVIARRTEERAARMERQETEARERAEHERARQDQESQAVHAQFIHVEVWGASVYVSNFGPLPVTGLRILWRERDITPGGGELDLQGRPVAPPPAGPSNRLVTRVPQEGPVRLTDLRVEFTDVRRRRWLRLGTGALYSAAPAPSGSTTWTQVAHTPPPAAEPATPVQCGYPAPSAPAPAYAAPGAATALAHGTATAALHKHTAWSLPASLLAVGLGCLLYLLLF
ncbi:hypothetical protein ACWGB8_23845 [Kitasatospora sp. NPDC054939]